MSFEDVDVEGECGEENLRQDGDFRRDAEALDAGEVEDAEDDEQKKQQRGDAGKADAVEGDGMHAGERSEAADGGERDEESGDGEEEGDAVIAVEEEQVIEPTRELGADGVRGGQMDVDVEQDDGEDGKAAQEVDAVVAGSGGGGGVG